jgi:hydrogenase nickel incorporation protein HypA/HybF
VQQRFDPCPRCGSYQLQVVGGEQMRIRDLEVE